MKKALTIGVTGLNETARVRSVSPAESSCELGDVGIWGDPRYFRPTEVEALLGGSTKVAKKLGWAPKFSHHELTFEIVGADLSAAKRDELAKSHGYQTLTSFE